MQGNTVNPDLEYPVEEYNYWLFADRYGWLPSQVDKEPAYLMEWILAIGNLKLEVEREAQNGNG